jgi:hypothetical protein
VQPGEHHRLRGHRLQVHLVGGSQLARHLNGRKLELEENKTLGPEIGRDLKLNTAQELRNYMPLKSQNSFPHTNCPLTYSTDAR